MRSRLTPSRHCSKMYMIMATASGLVIAVGELSGGGIAPVIVGQVAERIGIGRILWLPILMMAIGFLLSLFTRETGRLKSVAKR